MLDEFLGPNAGYVAELLERQPELMPEADRQVLSTLVAPPPVAMAAAPEGKASAAAAALAQGIRLFGHRAAKLDPLGLSEPPGDPQLDLGAHGVSLQELERLPASVVGGPVASAPGITNARQAIERLEALYCETTGYELAHVQDPAERVWLLQAVEEERFRPPNDPIDEQALLDRLTEVSAFERFLHRAYPGQTRFSIEGLGMLIPMLDELIVDAAAHGTRSIVLGMAHRGRLNVLAHVLGKPYARILAEFEGRLPSRRAAASESSDEGYAGDVKYHAGARRAIKADARSGTVTVVMAPNPSHLEFVDPVVEGMARGSQRDPTDGSALAVLIHGDASFPGQGVVAETLNLSRLAGYQTGGSLHVIANNQLGFTTTPGEGRSTLYASDLAKGFEMPIVHVNADDPMACLASIRLAVGYRAAFAKDILIDLIGYRRWGHNEGDDPSLTQPRVYAAIERKPTVRERFASDLVQRGVVREGEPAALLKAGLDEFQRIRESVSSAKADDGRVSDRSNGFQPPQPETPAPTWDALQRLNTALLELPEGFSLSRRLERAVARRRDAFNRPDAPIDWGHAETLAFATLLESGTPIRLTGQDTLRGTFSQRHLAFYDTRSGERYIPLAALPGRKADLDAHNSPLSESATLGFEYGYSVQRPEALVVWEAQYGDFINGAQVIVDEFVVSAQAKWGLVSGLVLLLPHAWEGQGPDHSGGRLERFLEMAAQDNIRVANCTTAAQYFHLLRRQAATLAHDPRPLVVMTPKSLLRHPLATSRAADLTSGGFRPVLDDARASEHPNRIERIVVCSGHVWADLESDERRASRSDLAVLRLEQLYPLPTQELTRLLDKYDRVREVAWLQEEPRNMGAWPYLHGCLQASVGREVSYIGRPESASPAEGGMEAHLAEQRRIIQEALQGVAVHAG